MSLISPLFWIVWLFINLFNRKNMKLVGYVVKLIQQLYHLSSWNAVVAQFLSGCVEHITKVHGKVFFSFAPFKLFHFFHTVSWQTSVSYTIISLFILTEIKYSSVVIRSFVNSTVNITSCVVISCVSIQVINVLYMLCQVSTSIVLWDIQLLTYSVAAQSTWYSTVLYHLVLLLVLQLYPNSFMEFLKNPSLVFYSSSDTPLLSVLSYRNQQQTIKSMLMILNFFYHSQLWISLITSLTLKTL